ncbi:MAG: lipase family protein, partial [Marinoscillum sp.]
MNPNLIRYLMILLVAPFVCSCSSEDPEPVFEATPYTLVDAKLKLTWTTADLKGFVDLGGIDLDEDKLKYNTSIYRVVYKTDYKGDSIAASAIVMLPETEDQVSTVSFQHGTIASDLEAPTNLKLGNNQMILLSILASTGLVVVVPDYIGFGESVEIMHPYYAEDLTATSVVNAIYASRQLVNQKNTNIDSDLYLAGYSQGGYATMATHKFFEEQGMSFYELKASFPSSGGYDVKAFQEYFFQLETFHRPFFMAYVANAYKVSFDWSE